MLESGERFFPRFDLLRATTNDYKTDFKRLASFDSPFLKNRLNVITSDIFRTMFPFPRRSRRRNCKPRETTLQRVAHYRMHKRQSGHINLFLALRVTFSRCCIEFAPEIEKV